MQAATTPSCGARLPVRPDDGAADPLARSSWCAAGLRDRAAGPVSAVLYARQGELRACRKVFPRTICKDFAPCGSFIDATNDKNMVIHRPNPKPKVRSYARDDVYAEVAARHPAA